MNSVYSCDLYLSTTEPIYNATLLIPLPSLLIPLPSLLIPLPSLLIPLPSAPDFDSGDYRTFLNISEVTFTNFDTNNISAKIEIQSNYPMLNLSAEKITPVYKSHIEPIAIFPGQNESELPSVPAIIYSESYSTKTPELVQMEIHRYYLKMI
ncbi:MAG: hypothetical protein PHI15_07750 [Methanomicrobium sp.]|nr:hypothetical protein [Methanomicrobium sp.]